MDRFEISEGSYLTVISDNYTNDIYNYSELLEGYIITNMDKEILASWDKEPTDKELFQSIIDYK